MQNRFSIMFYIFILFCSMSSVIGVVNQVRQIDQSLTSQVWCYQYIKKYYRFSMGNIIVSKELGNIKVNLTIFQALYNWSSADISTTNLTTTIYLSSPFLSCDIPFVCSRPWVGWLGPVRLLLTRTTRCSSYYLWLERLRIILIEKIWCCTSPIFSRSFTKLV